MTFSNSTIANYRLLNQGIAITKFEQPAEIVAWLGAVQAQDYAGTLWALGLRMHKPSLQAVEQAIADKKIVRTWPMRGTLHFIAPADVRWWLALLTPRVIANTAARYRQLELEEADFARSQELLIAALEGGRQLSRPEVYEVLERGKVSPAGQRGIHIISRLSQQGLLCFGPHDDKQPTFVLLDEWVLPASARRLERDEALVELAKRFFSSHGPATLQDLVRWTGLKITEARAGLEAVKSSFVSETLNGQTYWFSPETAKLPMPAPAVHLLPGFDEYLLGYGDRSAVLDPQYNQRIVPGGNGVFYPTIVSAGQVVGTWKRTVKKNMLTITPDPFSGLSTTQLAQLQTAAERYARFCGMPLTP